MNGNGYTPPSYAEAVHWAPPPQGWLKINVDAAVGSYASSFAMVVKDYKENMVFLASFISEALDSSLAEFKALEWATNCPFEFWRDNVMWCSDAQNLVKEVVDVSELIS